MRSKISRSFVLELLSSSTAYAVPLLRWRRLISTFARFIEVRFYKTVRKIDASSPAIRGGCVLVYFI